MWGALRNSITASMGRSRMGGSRVKSTMDLAPRKLLPILGHEQPQGQREVWHCGDTLTVPSRKRRWSGGRQRWRCRWGRGQAGGATLAAEPGIAEAREGHGAEQAELSLRWVRGRGSDTTRNMKSNWLDEEIKCSSLNQCFSHQIPSLNSISCKIWS
jgi:hypothetical protein